MPDDDTPLLDQRCGTCRHWGMRATHWNTMLHRTCDSPQVLYGPARGQGRASPRAAIVEMQEGWGLLTGPQWGCVHWEATPDVLAPDEGEEDEDGSTPTAA